MYVFVVPKKIYARNTKSQPFNFQNLENHHILKIAFHGWLTTVEVGIFTQIFYIHSWPG